MAYLLRIGGRTKTFSTLKQAEKAKRQAHAGNKSVKELHYSNKRGYFYKDVSSRKYKLQRTKKKRSRTVFGGLLKW